MHQDQICGWFSSRNHFLISIIRIGWWENLKETPVFDGKNHGFVDFPLTQSIESNATVKTNIENERSTQLRAGPVVAILEDQRPQETLHSF